MGKDERFRPTEEDKTFIKNISEKCVSAITNALLSDDEYIERLAQSQLEKIEKEKKEMREFEIETDKRILERIEIENRLLESFLEEEKKKRDENELVFWENILEEAKRAEM